MVAVWVRSASWYATRTGFFSHVETRLEYGSGGYDTIATMPQSHAIQPCLIRARLHILALPRPKHSTLISPHSGRNMSTEARASKQALRKELKTRLSDLPEDEVAAQSLKAQSAIISLPQYQAAKRVSIYLSMPTGEARTDLLVRDALSKEKKVFVPYIHSMPAQENHVGNAKGRKKVMEMLHLRSVAEYEALERDSWGIPHVPVTGIEGRENAMGGFAPSSSAAGESGGGLDLVVVPGVAFDEKMSRMGHGAGFYDSYLTRFCAVGRRKRPFLVGMCLAEQVLPEDRILMQDWDWRVNAVAVGDGRLLKAAESA